MKQRAAQNFEDVLQCAIPAFEGLFQDSHDEVVRILLFRLAEWHAFTKLRIHTDDSLDLLSQALRRLGQQLRKFRDSTYSVFQTVELPEEIAARQRKSVNLNSASAETGPSGARPKAFNIQTYKLHALGNYVNSIKMFGTTDSYTTQIGKLAHRLLKMFYQSTNKQDPLKQLASKETHSHQTSQNLARPATTLLETYYCWKLTIV
ncbi:hypothetical protein BDR07DRAFT_1488186 [Suillus spraguei]|nr:hypothetical protein BDR07DRAFT_1488186 [Suillus spraguei]